MTNKQVMQLMTDMGLHDGGMLNWIKNNGWVKFANKVAEKEREACARTCDDMSEGLVGDDVSGATGAGYCANAIRARGNE